MAYLSTGHRQSTGAGGLNPAALQAVTTVLVRWLRVTDREVTPDLMEKVFRVLYEVAVASLAAQEEHQDESGDEIQRLLSEQMKLVG